MTIATPPVIGRLQAIRTFSELIEYLREELDWPVHEGMAEDEAFFDYDPAEVGLDEASAVKIQRIRRLRPLVSGQPWAIFFIDFRPGKLPITVLRRILKALVLRKRASSDRQRWQAGDLLFVSTLGESGDRSINLAHFSDEGDGTGRATLRVVDWDEEDSHFHMLRTAEELEHLRWPENTQDLGTWRETWASAFRLKPGQVARTATQLATQMAGLAKLIRSRVNAAMEIESPDGPLRQMFQAFKQVLVSDLIEDGFADMYAQTITYGLFAARKSRPVVTADTARDMVTNTNPFLRDLLAEFTDVSGATKSLDFDELGIDALVAVLNQADIDAVIADFDDRNPAEDPVIHFYEDFLRQYDSKMKAKRGIFFTPRPVVSFIVRSVDETLRSEFGLKDGLADTTTWGEMVERGSGLVMPEGVGAGTPFVQILDPAVGTGTFLVEVIDVIWETMREKWRREGHMPLEFDRLWNEYVPTYLLPRLYGFELMMAPYAIAHMKIGLKLAATGYQFNVNERLRIFLTNTLEEPQDIAPQFETMAPALAHEAQAVNAIKRHQRFTVIIANPPYSKISSNLTPEMRSTVERYRSIDGQRIKERGALQFEINLQDDYVKFFRFCERQISASALGIMGLITNNGYLSTPTLRGMRDSLMETFQAIWTLDLHGHLAKGEHGPNGALEENVFDILQGVAIFLGSRLQDDATDAHIFHADCYGSRTAKYSFLTTHGRASTEFIRLEPSPPFYLFIPHDAVLMQEWRHGVGLGELFPRNSAGVITARDALVIAEDQRVLAERLERFRTARGEESAIYEEFGFSESKRFNLRESQAELRRLESLTEPIRRLLHRPFDRRFIFFHPSVVWSLSRPMADQMRRGDNVALVGTRQVTRPQFEHVFASRDMIEIKACSHDRNTQIFPLFLHTADGALALASRNTTNLSEAIFNRFAQSLGLTPKFGSRELGGAGELTPLGVFNYAYAALHSPVYRKRYFEFLRSEFPRLPLTRNRELFRALIRLGGELVALHLLESPKLDETSTGYTGAQKPAVTNVSYAAKTVWLDKAQTHGFRSVPEDVWNFYIGGYRVCEKWLKDRKGRTLSDEDIAHYQKIVVALNETIRIMGEIDEVIEKHGGWPGAFASPAPKS